MVAPYTVSQMFCWKRHGIISPDLPSHTIFWAIPDLELGDDITGPDLLESLGVCRLYPNPYRAFTAHASCFCIDPSTQWFPTSPIYYWYARRRGVYRRSMGGCEKDFPVIIVS